MTPSSAERSARLRTSMSLHTVALPGAINALSAQLIKRTGFEALYLSDAVLANSARGVPDIGETTLDAAEAHARAIANVTSIPIIIDADTGFGDTAEVGTCGRREWYPFGRSSFTETLRAFGGKTLVSRESFFENIGAAAAAKTSTDFLLIARTDARSVEGYDVAMQRAQSYIDAGADAVFPEALETREEFARFARDIDVPLLANMTEFGTSPYFTIDEFTEMGYVLVIFPITLQRVAMKAMESVLQEIRVTGSQQSSIDQMKTRQELYDLLEYDGDVGADPK